MTIFGKALVMRYMTERTKEAIDLIGLIGINYIGIILEKDPHHLDILITTEVKEYSTKL